MFTWLQSFAASKLGGTIAVLLGLVGGYKEGDLTKKSFIYPSTYTQYTSKKYPYFSEYMSKRNNTRHAVYNKTTPISMPENITMQQVTEKMFDNGLVNAKAFGIGASTCEHQCSKECTPEICSWSYWADKNNLKQPNDSEYKMDFYNNYENYLSDAKEQYGLNCHRFSISWPIVQPKNPQEVGEEQSWDYGVLDHYVEVYKSHLKLGIAPEVCFHHYDDPYWYLYGLGGFEKEENVKYFEQFCKKAYAYIMQNIAQDEEAVMQLNALSHQARWITFNAPDGYAYRGYWNNGGPPSLPEKNNMQMVAEVLKNTLVGHVNVYHGLKELHKDLDLEAKGIAAPQIITLLNIHQTDPAKKDKKGWALQIPNRLVLNFADMIKLEAVYNFFIKGEFKVELPALKPELGAKLFYKNEKAIGALDGVGVNYYSNRYQMFSKQTPITDKRLTNQGDTYYHYPQGLYRALLEITDRLVRPLEKASNKSIPVIISENGIATADKEKRERFYTDYLYAAALAVEHLKKDGYRLKLEGYWPWTLFDNYEWPGLEVKNKRTYGVFAVTDDGKHLQLKEGSKPLKQFANRLKEHMGNA